MSKTREATMRALQGATLDRRVGRPTRKGVNLTRNEISAAYAAAKTSHPSFPMGERFGYAPAVMKPKKFIKLHNDACAAGDELADNWTFVHPARPPAYDDGIGGTAGDVLRRKKEATHGDKIAQWDRFDALETVFKGALEEAYDGAYLADKKDDVMGFSHLTVNNLLDHLETKGLALTTLEKNTKLAEIQCEWDKNDDIGTYFTKVEKLEEEFDDHYGITWPEDLQLLQVVAQMYQCGIFTRKEIMAWESKADNDKTMANAKTYFTELWEECQRYGGTTAAASGFGESANNTTEAEAPTQLVNALKEVATAATADKEHIQQMSTANDDLLAIIKRQQQQLDALIEQNGHLTEALSKLKPNTRNNNNNNRHINNKRNRDEKDKGAKDRDAKDKEEPENKRPTGPKCPICGLRSHSMDKCWELESNAADRPEGWVSMLRRQ